MAGEPLLRPIWAGLKDNQRCHNRSLIVATGRQFGGRNFLSRLPVFKEKSPPTLLLSFGRTGVLNVRQKLLRDNILLMQQVRGRGGGNGFVNNPA